MLTAVVNLMFFWQFFYIYHLKKHILVLLNLVGRSVTYALDRARCEVALLASLRGLPLGGNGGWLL